MARIAFGASAIQSDNHASAAGPVVRDGRVAAYAGPNWAAACGASWKAHARRARSSYRTRPAARAPPAPRTRAILAFPKETYGNEIWCDHLPRFQLRPRCLLGNFGSGPAARDLPLARLARPAGLRRHYRARWIRLWGLPPHRRHR